MGRVKTISLITIIEDNYRINIQCVINTNGTFQNVNRIVNKLRFISDNEKKSRKKYRNKNKEKIKKYVQENKEKAKLQKRKYRLKNPETSAKWSRTAHLKRKGWGCNPLNKWFKGCNFHHTHIDEDHDSGIFIPKEIHNSIRHKYTDEESMKKINKVALDWLRHHLYTSNNNIVYG